MGSLSERLKQYRKREGLSINKLAQLTGISRRTLSRIEDDPHYHPSPRIKQRLSALGGKLRRYLACHSELACRGRRVEGLTNACHSEPACRGRRVEESSSRDHLEPRGTRMTMYDHLLTPIYHLPQTDEEFERAVAILGLPAAAGEPLPMLGALSSPWLRFIVLPPAPSPNASSNLSNR